MCVRLKITNFIRALDGNLTDVLLYRILETIYEQSENTLKDFLLHVALRVLMEPVVTRMGLKVAVLVLLTLQLNTGESDLFCF